MQGEEIPEDCTFAFDYTPDKFEERADVKILAIPKPTIVDLRFWNNTWDERQLMADYETNQRTMIQEMWSHLQ
jgi:hypothetical protein